MTGIINYGAGNIFSLKGALDRLHIPYCIIDRAEQLEACSHVIIPGVGHAGTAMKKLEATKMTPAIKALKKPVLGICVGMQLLTEHSEEGDAALLDIIPLRVKLFDGASGIRVPHMGWNSIKISDNPLFDNIDQDAQFYFVHSYFVKQDSSFSIATTNYGINFSAAICRDNFFGVQFHPEKSGSAGEQILVNFIKI